MHNEKDRLSTQLSAAAKSRLDRRRLLKTTGAASAAFAATPLLGRYKASAQDDLPREKSSATVDGTLRVLLKDDFHPDHNEFMRTELEAFAEAQGWDIEITDVAGFQGTGDLNQKLLGSVQAGNPDDLLINNGGVLNLHTLGVVENVDEVVQEFAGMYGEPIAGAEFDSTVDGEYWAVPFFTRSNGLWVREDIFAENGIDLKAGSENFDVLRESALAVSKPEENLWGWGMTVNRSGDGNSLVQRVLFSFGAHVQDEEGQVITFNTEETMAAFEWLKETYTDEKWAPMLPPGILSWTDSNNNEAMLSGQTVITMNAGTVYAKAVLDDVPFANSIALVPYPVRNSDNAQIQFMSDGTKFFVIEGAKNREASIDVMRHFLSRPVMERIWSISSGYALPAFTDGWTNPVVLDNENGRRASEIALTETDFNGLPWPGEDNDALAAISSGVYFTDMMSEILQGRDTEDVVDDYSSQFVQIYQEFGREGE